jgi:hypothetical protein
MDIQEVMNRTRLVPPAAAVLLWEAPFSPQSLRRTIGAHRSEICRDLAVKVYQMTAEGALLEPLVFRYRLNPANCGETGRARSAPEGSGGAPSRSDAE